MSIERLCEVSNLWSGNSLENIKTIYGRKPTNRKQMNRPLRKILNGLDNVDFIELRHALAIASICRDVLKKYKVDAKQFADELGKSEDEMQSILAGSYDFNLRILAKIDAVRMKFEAEYARQNLEEIISVPDYKDSEKPQQSSEPPNTENK